MKEIILRFGEQQHLLGILSVPDRPHPSAMPVLIPNTGVEHRVGPNRLHVHLCRAIADAGFPALRMDLSGMGDSTIPEGVLSDATHDLRAAMDYLQRQGYGERFTLIGLCSGASDSHMLARGDTRIVGAAFIDGFVFPTPRYYLTFVAQRLFDPARLWRLMSRRSISAEEAAKSEIIEGEIDYLLAPSREDMQRDLLLFMRRRMALCYVYTGQIQKVYNYAAQLTDAFPELRHYAGLDLHYLALADHTFSRSPMRSRLVELLLSWLRTKVVPRAVQARPDRAGDITMRAALTI